MNQPSHVNFNTPSLFNKHNWLWLLFICTLSALTAAYWYGLRMMVEWWDRPEYSHGYMIPVVALFILWQRLNNALAEPVQRASIGVWILIAGILALIIGKLTLLQIFIQYGFLISLVGVTVAFFGVHFVKTTWAAFAYLVFMIPLPSFVYSGLSEQLQLLSSQLGVIVIRLLGISVFLEGNVIDLGSMQLQVAEACSGLRYLFPLLSFGFLIGYLYRGPNWQRIALFLSAIPITILMNSFRIGVIGVTVDRWGIEMAQGFLHDFEGWIVFMGCVGILFLEIIGFRAFSQTKHHVFDLIDLNLPKLSNTVRDFTPSPYPQRFFLLATIIIALSTTWSLTRPERTENAPDRKAFINFPDEFKGWKGERVALERDILDKLALTDYLQLNYLYNNEQIPVNFYMAWYSSQSAAAAIHSPLVCIPGAGWIIDGLTQIEVPNVQHISGMPLRVNRAIIRKGNISQLVYFWYDGRNRDETNSIVAKWHVFWDLILHARSDGALVRLVTPLPDPSLTAKADQRLQQFLKDFYPLIPAYVP